MFIISRGLPDSYFVPLNSAAMPHNVIWSGLKPGSAWLKPVVYLTATYLILSILWILLSDSLAIKLTGKNTAALYQLQQAKGIFFVVLSGMVLFFLSRKFYRNLANSFLQRESLEQKFFALNEAAKEGIFDLNLKNMTAHINNKMKLFIPVSSDTIDDFWHAYKKRIHPDDIPQLTKEYRESVKSGKTVWQTECRLLGLDNKYYTVISSVYLLRTPATGKLSRLIGTILDISELRNLQAEQYEQLLKHKQELTTSIIRAQENERNRWAEELHDNVCQILTVTKLYLGEMGNRPDAITRLLPETKKLVSDAMTEIRQLSATIKPPSFSKMTLRESLQRLTADINRVKEISFNFEFESLNETKLDDEQKLLAYRVVQEQLNNIIKYADAKKVDISLRHDKEKLSIKVRDDGMGFDTTRMKTGLGFRNMQSRLQIYKGDMTIHSSIGKGCTLSAAFAV